MKFQIFLTIGLFFCSLSFIPAQIQIGQDIDGEAAGDYSGSYVALSADGNRLAVGAFYNNDNGIYAGQVRVFRLENNSWVQIGQDIDGEAANDHFGRSVSLSADGNRLAVGAFDNDGNGTDAGHVRVFRLENNSWIQVGQDIDGESVGDRFGWSVSLSADGNRLASGAYRNSGNGMGAGHARVFHLENNNWVQVGKDIDAEASHNYFGRSVSLSADGNRLAVGAESNSGNGPSSGHVRVYYLENNSWVQIGGDIDGENKGDHFGCAVSLSADGKRLAAGADWNDGNGADSGHVRVFKLKKNNWVQIGGDIAGENKGDHFGYSVSLSADGKLLAVGASRNDGNGTDSGHVRIFKLENNNWVQTGRDIDGEAADDNFGLTISLSADGKHVAVGSIYNDGNGTDSGHVRVFDSN